LSDTLIWEDKKNPASRIALEPASVEASFEYPYAFKTNETVIMHPGYSNYGLYKPYESFESTAARKTKLIISGDLNNDMVNSYYLSLKSEGYFDRFDIRKKWGYPLDPFYDQTQIKITYYHNGVENISEEKKAIIAECVPYRDNSPSFPYNLIRTEERQLNPYYANHTCCLDNGQPNNPNAWRVAASGYGCYDSYEIGTYYDFMEDPSNNISSILFREMNTSYDILNKEYNGDVRVPLDPAFDLYVRRLRGVCNGNRGNICQPEEFSILKIPFCGMKSDALNHYSPNYNFTVEDTFVDVANPLDIGYADERTCVCRTGGGARIFNISNSSEAGLFCCLDENGVPKEISDKPCILRDCVRYDINSPSGYKQKVRQTSFDPYSNNPGPYCYCSDFAPMVDTSDPVQGNMYCCNKNGVVYDLETNC
jgi:hypothetical protein